MPAERSLSASAAPPFPWRGWLTAAVVFAVLVWSARGTGVNGRAFVEGLPKMTEYFQRLLPSPGRPWPFEYLPKITERLLETIRMAFLASVIGSALALPFALVGTRNLASRTVYAVGRGFLSLLRTVPDLILATLLVAAFGIGPVAGVLALIVFTFGVVAKLLTDTVETIDPGPLEAITAAGGSRLQRAVFAVFPQVAPDYVAYTLYAFEINVRAGAVLGLVGAGGVGVVLNEAINLFRTGRVGLIIAITFAAVFVIDSLSTWLRSKLV